MRMQSLYLMIILACLAQMRMKNCPCEDVIVPIFALPKAHISCHTADSYEFDRSQKLESRQYAPQMRESEGGHIISSRLFPVDTNEALGEICFLKDFDSRNLLFITEAGPAYLVSYDSPYDNNWTQFPWRSIHTSINHTCTNWCYCEAET